MVTPKHRRRYQTRLVFVGFLISAVRVAGFVVVGVADRSLRIPAIAVAAVLVLPMWLVARLGIWVREDGVRIVTATSSRLVRWEDIKGFETTVRKNRCCGVVVLNSGQVLRSDFMSERDPNESGRREILEGVEELNTILAERHHVGPERRE